MAAAMVCLACSNEQNKQQEVVNQPEKKPNFLFILVDDLGYHDLGFSGTSFYETPNIDALAGKSYWFKNGYASCVVCSPSRASLLTGLHPVKHGITDYIGAPTGTDWPQYKRYTKLLPAQYQHHLKFEHKTIPEVLQDNGYATFFSGKWHLGSAEEKSLPTEHGFQTNIGGYHIGGPYKPGSGFFYPFLNPYLEESEEDKGKNLSMKLAEKTADFLESNGDKPFFAYLAFYAVHAPIQTREETWQKYRKKAESMYEDLLRKDEERLRQEEEREFQEAERKRYDATVIGEWSCLERIDGFDGCV